MSWMVTCLRDAVLITPYCCNTGQRSSVHFLTSIRDNAHYNLAPGFGAIPSAKVRHISHYSGHRPRKEFFVLLAIIKQPANTTRKEHLHSTLS
jgi:hypothetical protein